MNDTNRTEFEAWLRTVCFQPPTPEAYDLAKSAWHAARAQPKCVAVAGNGESLQKTKIEEFLSSAEGMAAVDKSIAESHAAIAGLNRARAVTREQMNTPMGVRPEPERVALSNAKILAILAAHEIGWGDEDGITPFNGDVGETHVKAVRAILAAQADLIQGAPRKTGNPVMAARDDGGTHLSHTAKDVIERAIDALDNLGAPHNAEELRAVLNEHSNGKRDDVAGDARDGERYRFAIALEDNAEMLYAAVLNNAPDHAAIGREFDAAIAASKAAS